MTWTRFWDMHSGGSQKEKWSLIYIEAPENEAITIFYNRFHHHPYHVTCSCCGDDYATSEGESLAEVTAYHRGCLHADGVDTEKSQLFGGYQKLEDFIESPNVLVVYDRDIKDRERIGSASEQEYMWVD